MKKYYFVFTIGLILSAPVAACDTDEDERLEKGKKLPQTKASNKKAADENDGDAPLLSPPKLPRKKHKSLLPQELLEEYLKIEAMKKAQMSQKKRTYK